MHNIVSFKYITESSAYLYRLTTQVSFWTEDIELRDNNHQLIIMHWPISHLSMTFQMSEQNWSSRTCPNIRNN